MNLARSGSCLLISVLVLGLNAGVASAAVTYCESAEPNIGKAMCLWKDANYETSGHPEHAFVGYNYAGHLGSHYYQGTSSIVGDTSSATSNNEDVEITYWSDANCSGYQFSKNPGGQDGNFNNGSPGGGGGFGYNFNDNLSSFYAHRSGKLTLCQSS